MDAYLDLSYIFHLFVLLTLPYYSKKIMNIKMRWFEVLSLGVFSLILYFNIFLFKSFPYINFIFLFIYFLFVYFKKCIKYYLLFLLVYYGNIASMMIISNYIYLMGGLVLLNKGGAFFFILLELMNIVVVEIILFSIRSIKLLKNYRKKIEIKFGNQFSEFSGYIDSGNTLINDGLPVIFLNEKYFEGEDYDEMIVSGIGSRKCKYFKTQVIIDNKEREVICASGNKNGFKGCDCLINIYLMEENENETTK